MAEPRQDMGASLRDRAGRASPQAPSGLGHAATIDLRLAAEINARVAAMPRLIKLHEGRRFSAYLMARNTERDWRLFGFWLPSRLWHFSRGTWSAHLYIFLPFARRLCLGWHKPINRPASVDTHRMAETGTGSVRSMGGAVGDSRDA